MSQLAIPVFIAAAVVAALLLVALDGSGGAELRARARRLSARTAGKETSGRRGERAVAQTLKRREHRSLPLIEALARRLLPRQSELRERLERTGLPLSNGAYALICIGVVISAAVLLRAGLHLPPGLCALLAFVIGCGLPHLCVGLLIRRNRARFIALFPDAVDLIVRGLKAGLPVGESMSAVAREMADPIAAEFTRVMDSVRFGRPLEEVLWETARRLSTPEFNFFVISLSIQRETGGNLAETLTNLSDILRRRRQIRLKVRALSSEAKASAAILAALPFVMFGLIYSVNPDYASALFTDPRGLLLLGAGLFSMVMALAVIYRLCRFEI